MTSAIFDEWPQEGKALLQSALSKPMQQQTFEEARAIIYYSEGRVWKSTSAVWEWERKAALEARQKGGKQNEGQKQHDN